MDRENQTGFLRNEIKRLRKSLEELSVLNEIATAISSTLELNEIIDLIVWKCIKHLDTEQAAVMLLDEKTPDKPLQTMIRKADKQTNGFIPFRLNSQITGWILKNKKPLLVNDIRTDEKFKWSLSDSSMIKSVLSVPLLHKGEVIGIISAFNKKNENNFTEEDKRLLSIIAAQSSQTIVNARLLEEEKKLLQLEQELKTAAEIQVNILPKEIPEIPGYDIAAINIPAREVGGDYYDFILKDDRIVFCLGDITGKGIPAALLMANLQATFRSQVKIHSTVKDITTSCNTLLKNSTEIDKYATFFAGILDYKNHKITYCNAGHNEPVKVSVNGETVRLSKGGIVLGIMNGIMYEEDTLQIETGDILVVYTDGITETMNSQGAEFGENRLLRIIVDYRNLTAAGLLEKIIKETETFSGQEPQSDDKTLLIIRRVK